MPSLMQRFAVLWTASLFNLSVCMAESLEAYAVMVLSPADGRAVVKSADGKMQVVQAGDRLEGSKAVVVQVLADKLVLELALMSDEHPGRKDMIWLYKAVEGRSHVQHLQRAPTGNEAKAAIPVSVSVESN